jgi:hypothetical protein
MIPFWRFGRASVPLAQKGVEHRAAVLGEREHRAGIQLDQDITSDLGSFHVILARSPSLVLERTTRNHHDQIFPIGGNGEWDHPLIARTDVCYPDHQCFRIGRCGA